MKTEQKEGLVISCGALLILFTIAMFTHWDNGFWQAWFGPDWFYYEVKNEIWNWQITEYPLRIKFSTVLIIIIPILTYGILRASAIIKRLFKFESYLSKIIPDDVNNL